MPIEHVRQHYFGKFNLSCLYQGYLCVNPILYIAPRDAFGFVAITLDALLI